MFAFYPLLFIFVIAPIALIVFGVVWVVNRFTGNDTNDNNNFWKLDNDKWW